MRVHYLHRMPAATMYAFGLFRKDEVDGILVESLVGLASFGTTGSTQSGSLLTGDNKYNT